MAGGPKRMGAPAFINSALRDSLSLFIIIFLESMQGGKEWACELDRTVCAFCLVNDL